MFSSTPVRVVWKCEACSHIQEIVGNAIKPIHCGKKMKPILVTAGKLHRQASSQGVTAP